MAHIQGGSNTAGVANVDSNYNAQVNLPYGTQGGGWGAFMPAYQKETDDDDILLAWFMLIRPYG